MHRLLAQFLDMRAHTKARDALLVFGEEVGAALTKACELDSDNDVVHLAQSCGGMCPVVDKLQHGQWQVRQGLCLPSDP